MKMSELLERAVEHCDMDADVTDESVAELNSFIAGQRAPHAVLTLGRNGITLQVTGHHTAWWRGRGTTDALAAAVKQMMSQGAATYEVLDAPPEKKWQYEVGRLYHTRKGGTARVVTCSDGASTGYPVRAVVDNRETLTYTLEGAHNHALPSGYDLMGEVSP